MPPGRPGDPHPWPYEEEGEGHGGEPSGVEAELAALAERQLARLQTLLPSIVARRVPLRAMTPGPAQGTARMRLADSTTVLVTSAQPGDLVRVVRALEDRAPVTIASWERTADGLFLVLAGPRGREPARLRLLGPDQPD